MLLDSDARWLSDAWLQQAAAGSSTCCGTGLSCRCWQISRRKPRVAINLQKTHMHGAQHRLFMSNLGMSFQLCYSWAIYLLLMQEGYGHLNCSMQNAVALTCHPHPACTSSCVAA